MLYDESLRTDLERPDRKDTLRYFRDRAPDELTFTLAKDFPTGSTNVKFAPVPLKDLSPVSLGGISQIEWEPSTNSLVTCDMFPNEVMMKSSTWNDILRAMISVRDAHGWKE